MLMGGGGGGSILPLDWLHDDVKRHSSFRNIEIS